jgi:hypothetical protein
MSKGTREGLGLDLGSSASASGFIPDLHALTVLAHPVSKPEFGLKLNKI